MKNYDLTIEDGVITWIETCASDNTPIPGILYIPKEAAAFSADALLALDEHIEGIVVHEDNPVFSSAHNCLLSKDGKKLIHACKNSDISKLTGVEAIGRNAFSILGLHPEEFVLRIPDGVEVVEYRAFALSADRVEITIPASVVYVNLLAFMIHSQRTHIIFEGDPQLRIGAFGTAAEAKDSGFDVFQSMPAILYSKPENITVTCKPHSKVYEYCKTYGIPTEV